MADNSKLLLLGGAAAAAWWFYIRKPATSTPATAAADKTAAGSTPAKVPSVSDIQAAVILAAKAPAEGLTVDEWGWYLNNALAPTGKSAPDPMPLFSGMVDTANATMAAFNAANNIPYTPQTFSRSNLVTASAYWAVMGPALKSQLGLSGLGMYRMVY